MTKGGRSENKKKAKNEVKNIKKRQYDQARGRVDAEGTWRLGSFAGELVVSWGEKETHAGVGEVRTLRISAKAHFGYP